jgi:hypothetical protein
MRRGRQVESNMTPRARMLSKSCRNARCGGSRPALRPSGWNSVRRSSTGFKGRVTGHRATPGAIEAVTLGGEETPDYR